MSKKYYKAVRMNGTSFASRSFHWLPLDHKAGETLSDYVVKHEYYDIRYGISNVNGRKSRIYRMIKDMPWTYLSVATDPMACIGFSWPARLLQVVPVAPVMGSDQGDEYDYKRCSQAWKVIGELPQSMLFGSNGDEVIRILERFASSQHPWERSEFEISHEYITMQRINSYAYDLPMSSRNAISNYMRDRAMHMTWPHVAAVAAMYRDAIPGDLYIQAVKRFYAAYPDMECDKEVRQMIAFEGLVI